MIRDFFFAPNVRRHAGRLHHQHEYTSCSGIGGRAGYSGPTDPLIPESTDPPIPVH